MSVGRPAKALLLAVAAAFSQPRPQQIDGIFRPLVDPNGPGLAVLVKSHSKIVFEQGYGKGITPRTDFRLASCTKQFTAMSILLLVHDGKLALNRRLTEIFPDFPAYGRDITVRHLLTHTAGLPDYEDLMGNGWSATHQIQDGEAFDLLKKQTAGKFAPGTKWEYSNSGYVVLGLIVAKVSGMPFRQFLHDRIFAPLHMNDTLLYVKGENEVPARAYGHSKLGGTLVQTDQSSTSATQGDGGVYSNLEDLSGWDDALAHHTLLSEAEMKPALTPAVLADGSPTKWPADPGGDNLAPGQPVSYGFGWFLDPYRGRERMWHYGSTMGFGTAIERFPADELTVIVLANRTDLDPGKLALEAADLMLAR